MLRLGLDYTDNDLFKLLLEKLKGIHKCMNITQGKQNEFNEDVIKIQRKIGLKFIAR